MLQSLTGTHFHTERALGDPGSSKSHSDNVLTSLCGPEGAAVGAVTLILHHRLHRILAALRVPDHGRHIPGTGACRRQEKEKELNSTQTRWSAAVSFKFSEEIQELQCNVSQHFNIESNLVASS